MTDAEFRSEIVDALNSIAANTQFISRKMDVLNKQLDTLKGIHSNVQRTAEAVKDVASELDNIKRNGLPVDC